MLDHVFLGLDPGKGGGMAAVDHQGRLVSAVAMPDTPRDVLEFLELVSDQAVAGGARAVLEKVASSPQMGVVSAFTFGRGCGHLQMGLLAAGIPYDEVSPMRWQAALGCLSKGDKNVTKRRAQELFPGLKVTHAIADAVLLAEYCRRVAGHVKEGRP